VNNLSKSGLLAVVGATATGKTAVGVELARVLNGEVVNADSRLFYRGMDVATAKPSETEMRGVPHHLFDILNPDEQFSLAEYLARARAVVNEIHDRGKLPVLVGGSGQYIWALIEGWEVPEIEPDPALRADLEKRLLEEGVHSLANELTSIAPGVAAETDLLNPRRVVRAIERVRSNSSTPTRKKSEEPPYDTMLIGLTVERSALHQRVVDRLDTMLENGWQREVKSLLSDGHSAEDRAMSGIGYRQMTRHLSGSINLEEAVRQTAVATNRLIRHQNTWFKRDDPRIHWFDMTGDTREQVKKIVETAKAWRSTDQ
jgi:tRNA dimethylallyltransferase